MKQAQVPLRSLCYDLLSLRNVCCEKHTFKHLLSQGDGQFVLTLKSSPERSTFWLLLNPASIFFFKSFPNSGSIYFVTENVAHVHPHYKDHDAWLHPPYMGWVCW